MTKADLQHRNKILETAIEHLKQSNKVASEALQNQSAENIRLSNSLRTYQFEIAKLQDIIGEGMRVNENQSKDIENLRLQIAELEDSRKRAEMAELFLQEQRDSWCGKHSELTERYNESLFAVRALAKLVN